jgi:hypothetical protein
MTPEEQAAHEVTKAQARERRAAAFAAMTAEQRAEHARASKAARAHEVAPALADLAAWVEAVPFAGDLRLNARERAQRQGELNMLGVRLVDLPRDKGAGALLLLREWEGRLRLHFVLVFVDAQGRAVRSLGWTLRLYETTPDGEVTFSTRELDTVIAALVDARARFTSQEPTLAEQIAAMRTAGEQWRRERSANENGAGDREAPR